MHHRVRGQWPGRSGLTYKQIVIGLVILGVLLAVLIPTVCTATDIAHRAMASSNASQIAKTYLVYTESGQAQQRITTPAQNPGGTRQTDTARDINDVAFILAHRQGLNDAKVWFTRPFGSSAYAWLKEKIDPCDEHYGGDLALAGVVIPHEVIAGDAAMATDVSPAFADTNPKSWAFVTGLPTDAPAATTPVLWTYGLQHNGKWSENSSYQGLGGHIAFMDGHLQWYEKLATDPNSELLTVYTGNATIGARTADWAQAIPAAGPTGARVVNAFGLGK